MLNVTTGHYAIHDNSIFLSWNSNAGVTTSEDKPLFTLRLSAKADGQINNQIALNNDLKAEAYNSDLETFKLNLNMRNIENGEFAIFQNMPNPFSNDTEISFIIPEASDVKITIYDVTGKVLMEKSKNYGKGYNSVSVSRDDLNFTSGVLYYKVENGANSAVKKMVMLAK
jgi:hypothetical protein